MATDIRDPNDPLVYRGGELPEVVVEADRPYKLFFGQLRDSIKAWQERNLYNQDYSGASDYIGAGLGMVGSEVARAATNLLSLGEYAAREILPSGITGRPARRYSAYESNPASYALAEAAMDVAPVPIVDDALRLAGRAATRNAARTATRTAARNLSEQVAQRSANPQQSAGFFNRVLPSLQKRFTADGDNDIYSMVGTMSDAERRQFLTDTMAESGANWQRYYNENPQRINEIVDLYKGVGVQELQAKVLALAQKADQMAPHPNIMIYDYPFFGSSLLYKNKYLPRLDAYLTDLVDKGKMTIDHKNKIMLEQPQRDSIGVSVGTAGFYEPQADFGASYPRRKTVTHEAAHALQGNVGREMLDMGIGRRKFSDYERKARASMSPAQRIEQDYKDLYNYNPSSLQAYEDVVGEMIDLGRNQFVQTAPWNTDASQNIIYNYIKAHKDKIKSKLGISDFMYDIILADSNVMSGASPYLKRPAEIQARVSGEFAEKLLSDSANNDFLKGIDPYNLPEYDKLTPKQRDYMFDTFFDAANRRSILPIGSDRRGGRVNITGQKFYGTPLADQILSGFYDIKTPKNLGKNNAIKPYENYKDILPKEVLWEMFRNVTRSVPAVAAGTTAAGYGVASGRNQSPDNKKK